MGNSTARAAAAAALADVLTDIPLGDPGSFESFERAAIEAGHSAMAAAMGRALERYDAALCLDPPPGCSAHDARARRLATEVGDVRFACRRLRDASGATVVPLADALDLPWGCRVPPGAEAFLVEAGAEVSYAAAARLLARKGGSRVSAATVMRTTRGRPASTPCATAAWRPRASSGRRRWPPWAASSTCRRWSGPASAPTARAGASGAGPTCP